MTKRKPHVFAFVSGKQINFFFLYFFRNFNSHQIKPSESEITVGWDVKEPTRRMQNADGVYLAWPALRICVKMLDNSSRFLFPRTCVPKRALQNFNARLSFEIFNNSMHLFSYGACPTTSRTKSRTNRVCLVWICG